MCMEKPETVFGDRRCFRGGADRKKGYGKSKKVSQGIALGYQGTRSICQSPEDRPEKRMLSKASSGSAFQLLGLTLLRYRWFMNFAGGSGPPAGISFSLLAR